MIRLVILAGALLHVAQGICVPLPQRTTFSYLILPFIGFYMEVDQDAGSPRVTIDAYDSSQHARFWLAAQFYECPGENFDFISLKSNSVLDGVKYYLASSPEGTVRLQADIGNKQFNNGSDRRLFKYTGGIDVDLTSLESPEGFLSLGSGGRLIYGGEKKFWSVLPFITRTAVVDYHLTEFRITFRINYQNRDVVLYHSSSNSLSITSYRPTSYRRLTAAELNFEVIIWRLYSGFETDGSIIVSSAIVLRTPYTTRYLAADVDGGAIKQQRRLYCNTRYTYNGYSYTGGRVLCLNYQPLLYKNYNDRTRGNTDIRNQNVVDERFFEVVAQSDGTTRLRSTMNPSKYLAMLKLSNSRFQLIIADLTTNLNDIVNYNFRITVPPRAETVMKLPRMPCDDSTQRHSQRSFFSCV